MRKLSTTLAAATGTALALGLATAGPAFATGQPDIIGGQTAEQAPWSAQISWEGDDAGLQCTGTIISKDWVLTAQQCVNGGPMSVRVGSATLGEGTQATVDQQQIAPDGDLALLHLSQPITGSYVKLADADPQVGAVDDIYGWGATAPESPPSSELRSAQVKVTGTDCADAYRGAAICSEGVDGSAYQADAGGPQMSDGAQVGVCSTSDAQSNTQQYASVAAHREWIHQVSGV